MEKNKWNNMNLRFKIYKYTGCKFYQPRNYIQERILKTIHTIKKIILSIEKTGHF